MEDLKVIGGGLAGSEAAWQAAERGLSVTIYEMRPIKMTGAHVTPYLSELVCSNSLGSNLIDRASGLLKEELRRMDSMVLDCADKTSVPAGGALAVDREEFSKMVTNRIIDHENIQIVREEILSIPDGLTLISTGPLTSEKLAKNIQRATGEDHLYFYDAISPIIDYESINMSIAFRESRYGRGSEDEGDYINCPFSVDEYEIFVHELINAEKIVLQEFDKGIRHGVRAGPKRFFEGCLPIEVIAERGETALAYGPMRPVGLVDPRTGKRPYAVVQLRQDNLAGTLYNMVGFQTNMSFSAQKRIFRLIPGLEDATFTRFGQMHRNTFIFSPAFLKSTMQTRDRQDLFLGGQIIGVEGYAGNIASGLIAGINAARYKENLALIRLPQTTMSGALLHYVTHASERDFQPMKANFGIMPPLLNRKIKGKRKRAQAYSDRALKDLDEFWKTENAHRQHCSGIN